MSETSTLERPVYTRSGRVLQITDTDAAAWYAVREREDTRLPQYALGTPVVVTDQLTGERFALQTAPCGLGCRCAADATPLDEAGRLFVGHECTLDGKPAVIAGRQLDAGVVANYPNGGRVEFAWPTIARIMANGGEFRS